MNKAVFQLEPLTCPSCIKRIETILHKQEGIDTVQVYFNSSKVRAQFDSTQINAGKIEEIINGLGYFVLSAKVS
jgi:copper chaperone